MPENVPENVSAPSAPQQLSPATLAVVAGRPARGLDSELNTPVSLSATFVGGDSLGAAALGYGRFANPTWEALERTVGELEGGRSLSFASGMAAVSAALHLVPADATVLVPHGAYNGTHSLTAQLAAQGRLRVQHVDITDVAAVRGALAGLAGGRALLWLESPTNPLLEVADIAALTAAGHEHGALVVVDNTFATPLLQRPLELGADVVVHSVTKFLSGHSDVVLGAVVARDEQLLAALHAHRTFHGAIPGPLEAFLALRGIRTLPLRLERSQASAAVLARRLREHPAVARVRHPSLPDDPGHALASAQMSGYGALVSIEVAGGRAAAQAVVDAVRLWVPATSLGGVESLVERRRRHANEPVVVPEELLRLSVGVEDVEDLWADLRQALDAARP